MNVTAAVRHNQTTFMALAISIMIAGGFLGCQAIKKPPQEIIYAAGKAAATIAPAAPPPYKELLILISSILSSGIFVDNRRKDTVIKVLKAQNAKAFPTPDPPALDDIPHPHR